ncbi:MAG: cell division protein FtsL [Nitrospinota bacterium]|nr:cell division protein FtsL [Nitrospinota bacterium]
MFKVVRNLVTEWFHVSPREFGVVVLTGFLFLACALVYVWPNVKMVNLAYEFQEQKRLHQDLIQKNNLLKLERDSLMSLDRIQYLAESQIGMKEPEPGQVVTILLK